MMAGEKFQQNTSNLLASLPVLHSIQDFGSCAWFSISPWLEKTENEPYPVLIPKQTLPQVNIWKHTSWPKQEQNSEKTEHWVAVKGLPSCLLQGIFPTKSCWKLHDNTSNIWLNVNPLATFLWDIAAHGNLHDVDPESFGRPGRFTNINSKKKIHSCPNSWGLHLTTAPVEWQNLWGIPWLWPHDLWDSVCHLLFDRGFPQCSFSTIGKQFHVVEWMLKVTVFVFASSDPKWLFLPHKLEANHSFSNIFSSNLLLHSWLWILLAENLSHIVQYLWPSHLSLGH